MFIVQSSAYQDLLKGKGKIANEGERRTWKDGITRKKVGKKWIVVKNVAPVKEKVLAEAESYFNYAMTTNMGDVVEYALTDLEIPSFDELVAKIKGGPSDTAHKIYKTIVDMINEYPGMKEDKQAAIHLIGTSLVRLRDHFSGPKITATVKKTSKLGKEYYEYDKGDDSTPSLKASVISAAKKKMGGWSVTGELKTSHVQNMIDKKNAKVVYGKLDSRRKWHMPKVHADFTFQYKGDSLKVRVKQARKAGEQKMRKTAVVELTIPYAFVPAFLESQIPGKILRNDYLHMVKQSKGYKDFLSRSTS